MRPKISVTVVAPPLSVSEIFQLDMNQWDAVGAVWDSGLWDAGIETIPSPTLRVSGTSRPNIKADNV